LAQLGTPDAPTPEALRRYLREFLSDRRVVDYPRWFWNPILHGIILNTRPAKSAALYEKVWTEEGSPLLLHTQNQARLLQEALGPDWVVDMGMRYGNPSLVAATERLLDQGLERIVLLPLFPQYSHTTTSSVYDVVHPLVRSRPDAPPLVSICSWADDPGYIGALAARAREHEERFGSPDRWLLSYHGIPRRYVRQGDPYADDCRRTSELLAAEMQWPREVWEMCFQSRFGPEPWLQPYTDRRLESLGAEGVGTLYALCPGFTADCLETLDEIGEVGAELFEASGGGRLDLVPCLNDHPAAVEAMADLVRRQVEPGT
jgi:ferrochelatase